MLFKAAGETIDDNVLVIRIQPDEGISLRMSAKMPGSSLRIEPVKMDFHYGTSFGKATPEAYERLLLDAMSGDATLFARRDEVEEAWKFVDAIREAWEKHPDDLAIYSRRYLGTDRGRRTAQAPRRDLEAAMSTALPIEPGLPVEISRIDKQLGKLWEDSGDTKTPRLLGQSRHLHRKPEAIQPNTEIIAKIAGEHACRALLVLANPDAPKSDAKAWISAHCHIAGARASGRSAPNKSPSSSTAKQSPACSTSFSRTWTPTSPLLLVAGRVPRTPG